ncbi:hypothetical protein HYS00_02145 [Candidatus Microgenomates bacterium]|nr:hypothetical protein [Candidatus Microgenomates bacterium]
MSFQSYTAKLIDKKTVKPDIYILTFALPPGQRVDFVAGQYLIMHVPQKNGEFARRLYSMANSPDTDTIELVVKRVEGGVATKYVDAMKVGDEMAFQAPAGVFTMKDGGRDIIMLATNTGIVPFRSMILDEVHKGPLTRDIHLYWGMRRFSELYYFDEFEELAQKEPRFHRSRAHSPHLAPVHAIWAV